jgi:hypothetical protein
MKTAASGFAHNAAFLTCAFLTTACASTQPVQSPSGQSMAVPGTAPQLPAISADRCVAEAIGTATDPNTGAPVGAAVDPQTGKPLCPSEQPNTTEPR